MPSSQGVPEDPASTASVAISREMTALMKEYLGRGPTRARTYISQNMIVCLLEDTMTKVEQNLKGIAGEHAVREIRHLFQGASRDQAIAAVERITGERVLSFMTDHDIAADISAQIFILERGEDHDARGAVGGSLDRAAESNEK